MSCAGARDVHEQPQRNLNQVSGPSWHDPILTSSLAAAVLTASAKGRANWNTGDMPVCRGGVSGTTFISRLSRKQYHEEARHASARRLSLVYGKREARRSRASGAEGGHRRRPTWHSRGSGWWPSAGLMELPSSDDRDSSRKKVSS